MASKLRKLFMAVFFLRAVHEAPTIPRLSRTSRTSRRLLSEVFLALQCHCDPRRKSNRINVIEIIKFSSFMLKIKF